MDFNNGIGIAEALGLALIVGVLMRARRNVLASGVPGARGLALVAGGFGLLLVHAVIGLVPTGNSGGALDLAGFIARIVGLALILLGVFVMLPVLRTLSSQANRSATALAATEQRLDAVAAHLPGIMFQMVHHPNGAIELPYVSGNALALLGLTPERARASPESFWSRVDVGDRAIAAARIAGLGPAPAPLSFELRYGGKGKAVHWLVCNVIAARRGDGSAMLEGIALDIGPQKLAQQRATDAETLLADAIDSAEDGFAVYDPDARLAAFNRNYALRLPEGMRFEIGDRFDDITRRIHASGARIPAFEGVPDSAPALDRFLAGPVEQLLADGRWLRVSARRTSAGGVVVVTSDITARKRIEAAEHAAAKAAAEAARMKSDFLANMSHELRTPLNAIIGFSETMAAQILGPLPDRYREYAHDIAVSAHHLLALIGDVLDLSKVEAGRMDLAHEPIDLAAAARDGVTMVAAQAEKGRLTIATDFPPSLPRLMGDRRRIVQVLLNLLSNAVKFTPAGGKITLAARPDRGGLSVTVADTGVGIAAPDIPRVMQDWGQARSDMSRAGEGTGLGLPLSRRLTELHDGTLTLKSTVGAGTTITLWFPPERVAAAPGAAVPS